MFLTLFGEKLNGTDPEDVIQNAFACFDQRNTGNVKMFPYCNKCNVSMMNDKSSVQRAFNWRQTISFE